ncbi:MAG: ABC transporter permease [Halanaerobium sp.]|nr:ABC transporter permease [Halanaerobium sp.]
MRQYIIRRILHGIPVILVVSFLIFIIINAAPGDPLSRLQNPNISKEDLAQRYESMGLNDPLLVRYARWLKGFIVGDFGYSTSSSRRPVEQIIASRIVPTLYLTAGAILISVILAIPIGIISAVKQYSVFDYLVTIFAFIGISIPTFYLALILLYLFSAQLPLFPPAGFSNPTGINNFWTYLHHAVLPILTLGLASVASLTRYMRSSMLEVIREDYVRTARAKGLKERVVIYKHALRNAIIPVITLLGMRMPFLFSGAVMTETVFAWPGMGRLIVQAAFERNYTVMMATNVIIAILVFVGNLLADITYAAVDPRIRYD